LSFPQDLDRWGNDRSLKSALYVSVCIHDSGQCTCGRMFLAVHVSVSECARDVCVCLCDCEFTIDVRVIEYEY